MTACYLNAMGILCSIGDSPKALENSLRSGQAGLTRSDQYSRGNAVPLGLYQQPLPELSLQAPKWRSRNNQFAMAALSQIEAPLAAAIERYGAHRIAVVIGTSTSGFAESEVAVKQWLDTGELPRNYDYAVHELGATAQFVAELAQLSGPVFGISTACSSGAKAMASARRLIRAGLCDAVITGGVDTLCQLTVQGFSALEAVSNEVCNPFSVNRKGINIGEAAALFLMTAEPQGIELCGVGEGSDAHHVSAPDPSGIGAIFTMQTALQDAALEAADIGYVNLHGTATRLNDEMESRAVNQVFGAATPCSSSKSFTGHTLGAAGALEAAICMQLMTSDAPFLPPHLWDGITDPSLLPLNLTSQTCHLDQPIDYAISNSFAFGGNNISLLLGRLS